MSTLSTSPLEDEDLDGRHGTMRIEEVARAMKKAGCVKTAHGWRRGLGPVRPGVEKEVRVDIFQQLSGTPGERGREAGRIDRPTSVRTSS